MGMKNRTCKMVKNTDTISMCRVKNTGATYYLYEYGENTDTTFYVNVWSEKHRHYLYVYSEKHRHYMWIPLKTK